MGEGGQGRCWDPIPDTPGRCRGRFCREGWTCCCAGRTHLCNRALQTVNVVEKSNVQDETATCAAQELSLVSGRELKLGSLHLGISLTGVRENNCNQISWWHNGIFRGEWQRTSNLSETESNEALLDRAVHTLLEIRPGDLFAFQFIDASYYCYKHFAKINLNGLEVTTDMVGVSSHYSREYTSGWFEPSFPMNGTRIGIDESETDLRKFLLPRKTMLDSGAEILSGIDNWAPEDYSSRDHRPGNWYWRIQLPLEIPTSFTF